MRLTRLFLLAASLAGAVAAQAPPGAVTQAPPGVPPEAPIPNRASIDPAADPCTDFYQYACGGWMTANTIPADRSTWGTGEMLVERNRQTLRRILEQAEDDKRPRDASSREIGDFYHACMDETTVDARGYGALKPELARIDALASKAAIRAEIPRLHRMGVDVFFEFGSETGPTDSRRTIAAAREGGLGLPDRDFYLNADARAREIRKAYAGHIQKMLELIGEAPEKAASDAAAVAAFETLLAQKTLDRVSRRNPEKVHHRLTVAELAALGPFLDWPEFFHAVGAPAFGSLDIDYPEFFSGLSAAFEAADVAGLQAYLRWHWVHAMAAFLSQPFGEEDFAFYGHILNGTQARPDRWKRCVTVTDSSLADALGKKYVDATFGAEGKQRVLAMVQQLERKMRENLETLDWMTPATKKEAFAKLDAITNRLGYPDKWRGYSSLPIARDDYAGNWIHAGEFEVRRDLQKIGQPVELKEWPFSAPTVNAGYAPEENSITFPAGILQPPLYSNASSDAANYGAGGAIIGHEMVHAFDDEGGKFDPRGNLRDWWTKADAEEFEKRAQCLVDEYSKFEAVPGVHLNGKLTLGENTADLGGLRLAFYALMDNLKGKDAKPLNGFSPEQAFFLSYGQALCSLQRPQTASMRAHTDPHSPPRFRVDGVVRNMPEFQKAFSCSEGKAMVAAPACRIW